MLNRKHYKKSISETKIIDLNPIGYQVKFGLNNVDKPLVISAELDDKSFIKFMEHEIIDRGMDLVKYFMGVKSYPDQCNNKINYVMANLSKSDSELIEKTNKAIAELVFPKYELQKAYNYYNGKRDPEQYRYLEENFGIGNPTSIEFIPLIKKHIDALVGEYLGLPIKPKITCKDSQTISKITREKELTISAEIFKYLEKKLKISLLSTFRRDLKTLLQTLPFRKNQTT